jgi:hypothetical protein
VTDEVCVLNVAYLGLLETLFQNASKSGTAAAKIEQSVVQQICPVALPLTVASLLAKASPDAQTQRDFAFCAANPNLANNTFDFWRASCWLRPGLNLTCDPSGVAFCYNSFKFNANSGQPVMPASLLWQSYWDCLSPLGEACINMYLANFTQPAAPAGAGLPASAYPAPFANGSQVTLSGSAAGPQNRRSVFMNTVSQLMLPVDFLTLTGFASRASTSACSMSEVLPDGTANMDYLPVKGILQQILLPHIVRRVRVSQLLFEGFDDFTTAMVMAQTRAKQQCPPDSAACVAQAITDAVSKNPQWQSPSRLPFFGTYPTAQLASQNLKSSVYNTGKAGATCKAPFIPDSVPTTSPAPATSAPTQNPMAATTPTPTAAPTASPTPATVQPTMSPGASCATGSILGSQAERCKLDFTGTIAAATRGCTPTFNPWQTYADCLSSIASVCFEMRKNDTSEFAAIAPPGPTTVSKQLFYPGPYANISASGSLIGASRSCAPILVKGQAAAPTAAPAVSIDNSCSIDSGVNIYEYEGASTFAFWSPPTVVRGSEGQWAPFTQDTTARPQYLDYFVSSARRSVSLEYKYDLLFEGVTMRRYGLQEKMFVSSAENGKFFMDDPSCHVFPMAAAYSNARITLSLPYFANMRDSYYSKSCTSPCPTELQWDTARYSECGAGAGSIGQVFGASGPFSLASFNSRKEPANFSKSVIYVDVEPYTGTQLSAQLALQLNYDMQSWRSPDGISGFWLSTDSQRSQLQSVFSPGNPRYWPVLYQVERGLISREDAQSLGSSLYGGVKKIAQLQVAGVLMFVLGILLIVVMILRAKKKRRRAERKQALGDNLAL